MKTTSIKILLVLIIANLASCKNESSEASTSFSDFQFADQPQNINCASSHDKLLNEAIYTFEKDIADLYNVELRNVLRAYNLFMRQATRSTIRYEDFVSEHAIEVAQALSELGIIGKGNLKYNHETMECIATNMQNDGLKTTLNALLSTNSMRKELYQPALQGSAQKVSKDKYLGLYVALEYYYAEILKVDFSGIDFTKQKYIFNA